MQWTSCRAVWSAAAVLMLFLFASSAMADDASDALGSVDDNEVISRVVNQHIRIVPQMNDLNFAYGHYNGIRFYRVKSIQRVLFHKEILEANVRGLEFEANRITMDVFHPLLGGGSVQFVFSTDMSGQPSTEEIVYILLNDLGDDDHRYVFGNPATHVYCLSACSFLFEPADLVKLTRAEAEQQGYRPCGACFKKMLYLENLSLERAIEQQWANRLLAYETMPEDSERNIYLKKVGSRLVDNWPFPRIGYTYSFHVVNSMQLKIFAIPTGNIVLSLALMDALENEQELEALLLHAIAHVERRHSLKQYLELSEQSENSKMLKNLMSAAGTLAGAVGGGMLGALGSLAVLEQTEAIGTSMTYRPEYIEEADLLAGLYFALHGQNRRNIGSLIQKLEFNRMTEQFHPDVADHPRFDLAERLERISETGFSYFGNRARYINRDILNYPVQLDLIFQSRFKDLHIINVYLDDRSILLNANGDSLYQNVSLVIQDANGKQEFRYRKRSATPDVYGVNLTFQRSSDEPHLFLDKIQKVDMRVASPPLAADKAEGPQIETFHFEEGSRKELMQKASAFNIPATK